MNLNNGQDDTAAQEEITGVDENPTEPDSPTGTMDCLEEQPAESTSSEQHPADDDSLQAAPDGEEQDAFTDEKSALTAECDRLKRDAADLWDVCTKLFQETETFRKQRDRLIVAALEQMGAIDGEYLLEKTKWDGVTDFEQIFKQIKSRFPQFFRPRLEGVRPMGRSQEDVPDDLSFRDRLRLFDENPEGYRGRFGR